LPGLYYCALSKAYLTCALQWLHVQRWRRNCQISLPIDSGTGGDFVVAARDNASGGADDVDAALFERPKE
jgi:hypothetical protein